MVVESGSVFRPFLQEFFVKASDPLFTCTLKLDVLTALVTEDNCATILGELQTYVLHRDKSFVCAAVRAVGRVADARPEAADQCLNVSALFTVLERPSTRLGCTCGMMRSPVCAHHTCASGSPNDLLISSRWAS